MKLKNKMLVICLILFVLIGITAVSAADNNADSIGANNNETVSLSVDNPNDVEILTADEGSFSDLQTKINGGSSNIELDKDYKYSDSDTITTGIVIDKNNFTIDGKGHTIDANGNSRIFYVNGTTVTLKNIIFKNGFASLGGAIYGLGDNLRVTNCSFINNSANWGGAIFSNPDSLSVFSDSTFIKNNAKYGGAISTYYVDYYGNKQYVRNSTFIDNTASLYGGAVLVYGKQPTTERPYTDVVTISGSKFINNNAPEGSAISNFYSASVNIDNSIFLGGEGSYIDSDARFVNASYNWFGSTYDNRTKRPNVDDAVDVYNWLYLDLIPDIANSIATVSINNLYNPETGETSIYSTSKLPSIEVNLSFTGIDLDVNKVVLDNTGKNTFNLNLVGDCEITATCEGSTVTKKIKAGSFSQLQSIINNAADGSTIKLDKDYVYMRGVDSRYGIVISNKRNLVIDGNGYNINGLNTASMFVVEKSSTSITFKNMNLVNGYADANGHAGSAINTHADYTNIINCTFYNNINHGLTGGAAVYGYASNGKVSNSRFINNTHTYSSAGALYWRGEGLTVDNTLFENNTATSEVDVAGGAVYLHDGGKVINSTFYHNAADYSGAIYGYEYTIDSCTFVGNVALTDDMFIGGGAIHANNITVLNSVFMDNIAKSGSSLLIASSNAVIDRCLFVNSTSDKSIVLSVAKGGKISNSIFLNNDLPLSMPVISCVYENLHTDYNWYGSYWKDYDKTIWDVSTLADMTKWLFLNYTTPIYNNITKEFQTKLNFLVYDSTTKRVVDYDFDDLPPITFSLSGENVTLNKNNVKPGEIISGTANYHKGNLVVQYGDVKYVIPFHFRQPTKIIVNSTIDIIEGNTSSSGAYVDVFNQEYSYFLEQKGHLTYRSNDTSIFTVNSHGKITAKKLGVAELFIKFDGTDVMGRDMYLPSNATVIINVTKIPTYIKSVFDVPTELEVGNSGNMIFSVINAVKNRSISAGQLTFETDNPEALKIDVIGTNSFQYKTLKNGTATVTVKFAGNDDYEPSTYVFTVTIGQRDPKLNVTPSELDLVVGNSYGVGIDARPTSTYGKFEYISNDTSVAIMEYEYNMHTVKAIGKGVANITIRFIGDTQYKPAEVYLIVHVNNIQTHIVVDEAVNMSKTDQYGINPAVLDENNKPIGAVFEFISNDTSVVSVDEYGVVTGVGLGKANITINYKGTDKYAPSSANVIVTVSTAKNEIRVVSDVEIQVGKIANLNATLQYGGKLLYVSSNSSVVSVDSKGIISARKIGEATITVTYEGSDKYDPATKTVNVKVVHVPTSIDVEKTFAVEVGSAVNLNAKLNPKIGILTYSIGDESIAKVSSNGVITGVGVGKTTLNINFAGNDRYAPSNATVEITVYTDNVPTTIDVNGTFDLFVGDNVNLDAVLNPANAGNLTYVSSDDKVVTVDENGKLTAVGEGSANITVSFEGNNKFLPSSANVLVTVSLIHTSIEVNDTLTVNMTETADIDYVFSHPEAGDLEFIVDDPSVAYIEGGQIIGDKVGQTTLTIKFAGNDKYAPSSATVNVVVTDVETVIEVEDTVKVNVTENCVIDAKLNPEEAGKLRFSTKDTGIISIDSNGKVHGIKLGTATVTITFNGNGKYRAVTKNVTVEVVDVETTIDVEDSFKLNVTDFKTIDAKLNPEEAGKLIFTADNEFISVDEKGRIEGLKRGNGTLTITFNGNGKYRAVTKNVTVEVVDVDTNIVVNVTDLTMKYGEETTIKADIKPDAVQPLIFTSSNPEVVTVDEDGNVKAVKPGVANITVSFNGGGKYKPTNKTITVTVERAPTSISVPETADVEVGAGVKLNVTTDPLNLNLTYSSSDDEIVEVDQDGRIFTISGGNAVITIKYDGNEYYFPSNATVTINVDKRDTMIQVENDVVIGFSESKSLGAKLISVKYGMPITGKLNYVSSDDSIVSVDENGRITANKIGNATITITYDGVSANKPCNATVNVEVTTKTTTIKFEESEKSLNVDDTYKVTATLEGGPDEYMIIYTSSDSTVARVNPFTGEVTAVGEGTAKITASYAGDDEYHSSEAEFTVSVSRFVTHISASNSYDMLVFETIDLHAFVIQNEEAPLSYSSSEEDVVMVNTKGEVTALKSGSAVITISYAGNNKYQPCQKQVIVNVAKIPTSINVDDVIVIYSGDQYALTDILVPADAPTRYLSYDVDDWDIVTDVDSNGVITAGHEGVTELTINYEGNSAYLPSTKAVVIHVLKKVISEDDYNFTVDVDHDAGEATFTLTLPEDAEGNFQVIINGEPYAEPVENGKSVVTVGDLTPGDYKATLRYTGDQRYASINNATTFHVGKYKIDKNKDQDIYVDGTLKYTVHLTMDTQAMEGKTITFKVNGKTYYAKTDVQGYATINVKLPAKIKTYTVTAQFKSIKVSNKVKVHVIVAKNLNYKKTSKHTVKITLKKLNKKYLANKKVTLKFNGKTYTGKTNKKGAVSFVLPKSVFSNLKVGKSYKYTVKYSTDTVTKLIKIFK
ncbi:Ig-like domain-containing protein [Methanobrevibacter sp.]|uniref:Ig-like domain-containing protein n=1 Tax=Methanobrevibacter sp. TaxID=66852 RepID=UPI00388DEF91